MKKSLALVCEAVWAFISQHGECGLGFGMMSAYMCVRDTFLLCLFFFCVIPVRHWHTLTQEIRQSSCDSMGLTCEWMPALRAKKKCLRPGTQGEISTSHCSSRFSMHVVGWYYSAAAEKRKGETPRGSSAIGAMSLKVWIPFFVVSQPCTVRLAPMT